MAQAEKFEAAKKEIRSLLITYQKGTSLSEFRKEYRKIIGRTLPYSDFNYKDEVTFLRAMPDVVIVYNSPIPGDYHLCGVADQSVKHIQKMVGKQKVSKHRVSYRPPPKKVSYNYSSYSNNYTYVPPPRFVKKDIPAGVDTYVVKMLEKYPNGVKLSNFLDSFRRLFLRQFTFRDWGFSTLEDCLENIHGVSKKTINNEILVYLSKNLPNANYQAKSSAIRNTKANATNQPTKESGSASLDYFDKDISKNAKSSTPHISKGNIANHTTKDSGNASLDYFDGDINENESESNTQVKKHGIKTEGSKDFLINRCIEDSYQQSQSKDSLNNVEELLLSPKDFLQPQQRPSSFTEQLQKPFHQSNSDTLDTFTMDDFNQKWQSNIKSSDNYEDQNAYNYLDEDGEIYNSESISPTSDASLSLVSESIRFNLQKVIDQFPQGLIAVDFPKNYQKITHTELDLHSLGYNSLLELVESVPDILKSKRLAGSKKDWIIYSSDTPQEIINEANGSGKSSALFVNCVIINTRKILQAYPEGVKVDEFLDVYSVNCNDVLYISDLGFDKVENFLFSIAEQVPLQIKLHGDYKYVYMDTFGTRRSKEIIRPPVPAIVERSLPPDIASPNTKFRDLVLPVDFDGYKEYVPVYTATISNPGFFYIQLKGEEYSEPLTTLYDNIDEFYKSELGDLYQMKLEDIKEGLSCIALWTGDNTYHRARIAYILSIDSVMVFYVDYGTTEKVPVHMLRYIRKEYVDFPIQAIQCNLAYLKPPNNEAKWDNRSQKRFLQLCRNKEMVGKIEYVEDGIMSIILCDMTGKKDIFINDVMIEENYAEQKLREEPEAYVEPSQNLPLGAYGGAMPQNINPAMGLQVMQQFMQCFATAMNLNAMQTVTPRPAVPPAPGFTYPQVPMSTTPYMPMMTNPLNAYQASPFGLPGPTYMNSIQPPISYPGVDAPVINEVVSGSDTIYKTSIKENSSPAESSPDDDIFDDDDDGFEELFQSITRKQASTQFVKRVRTTDSYLFHIILHEAKPYVSGGDISFLIWSAKSPFYMLERLPGKEIVLPSITLSENFHKELFVQLEKYSVKGIEKDDNQASVLLYPLENVNQILNVFGHPSAALRTKIKTECTSFNPSKACWKKYGDDEEVSDREDELNIIDDLKTDDLKVVHGMSRLCLSDLKTMKDCLKIKRLKALENKGTLSREQQEEVNKNNRMFTWVRERIQEIETITQCFNEKS